MRPLEPISLDDPAGSRQPQHEVAKVHATPAKAQTTADPLPAKLHAAPVPLTFAQTFGAMFLAILAAAAVIWIVVYVTLSIRENNRLNKEVDELIHGKP